MGELDSAARFLRFAGNFVFSLTDHAQNGFFHQIEWLPVVSSAVAVGFLVVPIVTRVTVPYLWLCVAVLACQALVGVLALIALWTLAPHVRAER